MDYTTSTGYRLAQDRTRYLVRDTELRRRNAAALMSRQCGAGTLSAARPARPLRSAVVGIAAAAVVAGALTWGTAVSAPTPVLQIEEPAPLEDTVPQPKPIPFEHR